MEYDAVVVGGSFAGLSAALYIARSRRSVLIVDAARTHDWFRETTRRSLAEDGRRPADILEDARRQLTTYPTVTVTQGEVVAVKSVANQFEIELADGSRAAGRRILLSSQMPSPFAAHLGCEFDETPMGQIVRTDAWKQTTVPGVYAAGDFPRMQQSIVSAAVDGASAGVGIHQSLADHVASQTLRAPRREGEQVQRITTAPAAPSDDQLILTVQQWMLSALGDPITVKEMASKAHMSRRNFHRRFVERTSTPPLAWLQQQRIGLTKELLESTRLTVEEIATHVGFGSPANLRQHFRRATSLSPVRYRELFFHS